VTETIKIEVPPGVEQGDHLLVRGKGEGGPFGGPSGDLYVGINIEPDRRFERDHTDLLTSVTIEMAEAALGKELEMESIDGGYTLKVPAGTQPGTVVKVKGKGLPPRGGGRRGSVLIKVQVSVPTKLSGHQRKLLEQLLETCSEKVRG
jgi:molecular chaperone DnaJ